MDDKIEAQALAEKCEVAAHYLTFPFMALSIKEQHEAAAVLRECAEAIKAADTEINALRTLLGDAAEKLTQTEAVRALAQGEPGEACTNRYGCKCPMHYQMPAASAPAAKREPRSTFRKCEHCGCETNAKMRACCRAGWVDDKVASETRIAGIGTKEPSNG